MALELAPSILDADFARIGETLRMLADGGAHWLHLDVMDNHFVPNLTFGPPVAADLVAACPLPAEAHLMVTNAGSLVEPFARADCKRILVHPEGEWNLHRLLQTIVAAGARPGVVLNPATPLCAVEAVLGMVDLVLVMTVNPGFGGQQFIEDALDKVRNLVALRGERGFTYRIEVDGGVKDGTIETCVAAGADTFVIGSAICTAEDPRKALEHYVRRLVELEKGTGA